MPANHNSPSNEANDLFKNSIMFRKIRETQWYALEITKIILRRSKIDLKFSTYDKTPNLK